MADYAKDLNLVNTAREAIVMDYFGGKITAEVAGAQLQGLAVAAENGLKSMSAKVKEDAAKLLTEIKANIAKITGTSEPDPAAE